MIDKVREIVRKEGEEAYWKTHVSVVVKYAKELARKESVDEELVELAALLHDIGRFRYGPENHETTGAREAEKILRELNYPEETIKEVRHCVETHRASKDNPAKTIYAKIIRDADALSHFDMIPMLIQVGLKNFDGDLEKTVNWVNSKIERDWNNKIHLPESKEIVEEKYKAAKLLLDATKQYL